MWHGSGVRRETVPAPRNATCPPRGREGGREGSTGPTTHSPSRAVQLLGHDVGGVGHDPGGRGAVEAPLHKHRCQGAHGAVHGRVATGRGVDGGACSPSSAEQQQTARVTVVHPRCRHAPGAMPVGPPCARRPTRLCRSIPRGTGQNIGTCPGWSCCRTGLRHRARAQTRQGYSSSPPGRRQRWSWWSLHHRSSCVGATDPAVPDTGTGGTKVLDVRAQAPQRHSPPPPPTHTLPNPPPPPHIPGTTRAGARRGGLARGGGVAPCVAREAHAGARQGVLTHRTHRRAGRREGAEGARRARDRGRAAAARGAIEARLWIVIHVIWNER